MGKPIAIARQSHTRYYSVQYRYCSQQPGIQVALFCNGADASVTWSSSAIIGDRQPPGSISVSCSVLVGYKLRHALRRAQGEDQLQLLVGGQVHDAVGRSCRHQSHDPRNKRLRGLHVPDVDFPLHFE
jgi:hypothetical protein